MVMTTRSLEEGFGPIDAPLEEAHGCGCRCGCPTCDGGSGFERPARPGAIQVPHGLRGRGLVDEEGFGPVSAPMEEESMHPYPPEYDDPGLNADEPEPLAPPGTYTNDPTQEPFCPFCGATETAAPAHLVRSGEWEKMSWQEQGDAGRDGFVRGYKADNWSECIRCGTWFPEHLAHQFPSRKERGSFEPGKRVWRSVGDRLWVVDDLGPQLVKPGPLSGKKLKITRLPGPPGTF